MITGVTLGQTAGAMLTSCHIFDVWKHRMAVSFLGEAVMGRCILPVGRVITRSIMPFVEASLQAGYTMTADYNGYRQEGFGPADMTVWKGRRWSTANAYLKPAIKKGNVRLFTRTLADRILFEGTARRWYSCLAQGQMPRRYRAKGSRSYVQVRLQVRQFCSGQVLAVPIPFKGLA
jgi:choline dehydrogenase-like flavoprotein